MKTPPAPSNVLAFKALGGQTLTIPQNVEAEQALIGAVFLNNEAFYRAGDRLQAEHFNEPIHREIWSVINQLVRVGKTANPITVKTFLQEQFTPELTMAQYLAALAVEATTVLNARDYADIIYDQAIRRQLIATSQQIAHEAYFAGPEVKAAQQIEAAEKSLYALAASGGVPTGFQPFNVALTAAIKMAAEAYQRDGTLSGLATGLHDLDRLMGGLQRSDLIILAARPGMGKTALATNIAFHVANAHRTAVDADGKKVDIDGAAVAFFSLEMSAEQLATRVLSEQASISSSEIRRGAIHESQFNDLVQVANRLSSITLEIDDTGGLNISQLTSRARRLKRQKNIGLIVIDYVQLLVGSNSRQDNRVQELTEITGALKALAKELDIPIIALAQLNRSVEAREDKHPQLADLRDSGSIEQDADVVLFIYREEYYLRNAEPKEGGAEHLAWQDEMERAHGRAEVIIGKQRHGPTGTVQVSYEGKFTRFGNLARDTHLPEVRS